MYIHGDTCTFGPVWIPWRDMGRLGKFFKTYSDFFVYCIFGAMATAVNMGSYYLLYEHMGIGNILATAIAWFLAVTFAFFTNKFFVFREPSMQVGKVLVELVSFFGGRIGTGLLDILIMWLAVDILHSHEMLWKLISNLIVGVVNYLFGKLIIFRKQHQDPRQ